MKKVIVILLIVALIALTACAKQVSEVAIDARCIPAHEEIETTHEYKMDIFSEGMFKLMPNVHTVYIPEQYEVFYETTYDNGNVAKGWRPVDYATYKDVCAQIGKDGIS